uniref:G domain-containing protein n=1 Tax=Setaria digitata TaxID=48799 RepID=A0A915PRL8_9BILA
MNRLPVIRKWAHHDAITASSNFGMFSRSRIRLQQEAQKCLKIAVIGPPNVGKSLLTNKLVKAGVAAVSSQMDTTQKNQTAVITEGLSQLVFVDSPGTVGIRHARQIVRRPDSRILSDPEHAIEQADHILVVHDATISTDYILHRVLHMLHRYRQIPSSLILNKIDQVTQRSDLLALTRVLCNGVVDGKPITVKRQSGGQLAKLCSKILKTSPTMPLHSIEERAQDEQWQEKYKVLLQKPTHKCSWNETKQLFANIKGWSNFQAVFFVSALTGEGINTVRDFLLRLALRREHIFKQEILTTKKPVMICQDAIRAEFLNRIPSYIAYDLKVNVTEWVMEGEVLQIVAEIECKKDRIARIVVGEHGLTVAAVAKEVNESLQNLLAQQLFLRILVKVNGKLFDLLRYNVERNRGKESLRL